MIEAQQEQNSAKRSVSNRATTHILGRSFLIAHLLTGDSNHAERAVMDAIDLWNPDEDDEEGLFQITLRTAVQLQITVSSAISNNKCTADCWLPVELCRIVELSPESRNCFVLRVLAGFPSHACGEILHLDTHQVNQYYCDAITNLADSRLSRGP